MTKSLANKKRLTIFLGLIAVFQIIIKAMVFLVDLKNPAFNSLKPILEFLGASGNIVITIAFWIVFVCVILYGIYTDDLFGFMPQCGISFINLVLAEGLSESFFDKCSRFIFERWREIFIVLGSIVVLVLIVKFSGKIKRFKNIFTKKLTNNYKQLQSQKSNLAETQPNGDSEEKGIDDEKMPIDEELFNEHPYLYSINHSRMLKRSERLNRKNAGSSKNAKTRFGLTFEINEMTISTILSGCVLIAVVIVIFFLLFTPDGMELKVFDGVLGNILSFLSGLNMQSESVEGNTQNFLFSLGTFLLIPIILLLIVLTVFFAIIVVCFCVLNIKIIMLYITDISKKILYFFFETLTSVISPFILLPDFISTVASVLFDVNVETHIDQKVNEKIKSLKNNKEDK